MPPTKVVIKEVVDKKEVDKKDEVIINEDEKQAKKISITKKPKEDKKPEQPKPIEKKETKPKSVRAIQSSFDMFGEDDIDFRQILMNYDVSKNRTSPRITKYECSLMIGKRAEMIQQGANPNVIVLPGQSAIEIAEEELRQGKIPFIIKRPLGTTYEYWKPADMEIIMQ